MIMGQVLRERPLLPHPVEEIQREATWMPSNFSDGQIGVEFAQNHLEKMIS